MATELYNRGLKARKRVLGEDYVDRAISAADSFNRDFQEIVTEYCWDSVWGRSVLDDNNVA